MWTRPRAPRRRIGRPRGRGFANAGQRPRPARRLARRGVREGGSVQPWAPQCVVIPCRVPCPYLPATRSARTRDRNMFRDVLHAPSSISVTWYSRWRSARGHDGERAWRIPSRRWVTYLFLFFFPLSSISLLPLLRYHCEDRRRFWINFRRSVESGDNRRTLMLSAFLYSAKCVVRARARALVC